MIYRQFRDASLPWQQCPGCAEGKLSAVTSASTSPTGSDKPVGHLTQHFCSRAAAALASLSISLYLDMNQVRFYCIFFFLIARLLYYCVSLCGKKTSLLCFHRIRQFETKPQLIDWLSTCELHPCIKCTMKYRCWAHF